MLQHSSNPADAVAQSPSTPESDSPVALAGGQPAPADSLGDSPPPPVADDPPPAFERLPGETPRAFSAFTVFFGLGHTRSLPAVAAELDEQLGTVKKWSSRFRWNARVQSFNSGVLQQNVAAETALHARQAADWARRTTLYREQEWDTAQKLLSAVQCFLDSFGDRDVEKMTLAQVSRALQVSSRLARQALGGTAVSEGPALVPLQVELFAALKKAYSQPPGPSPLQPLATSAPASVPCPQPSTPNLQPN